MQTETKAKYEFSEALKHLTPRQYWLLSHQITAFWHGFGISNGLDLKAGQDDLGTIEFPKGEPKTMLQVRKQTMLKFLVEYNRWLKSYRKSWNEPSSDFDIRIYPDWEAFLKDESHFPERLEILQMIDQLQDGKFWSLGLCPNCGKPMRPLQKSTEKTYSYRCDFDGSISDLPDQEEEEGDSSAFCPKCGTETDQSPCPKCGHDFGGD